MRFFGVFWNVMLFQDLGLGGQGLVFHRAALCRFISTLF